MYLPLKELKTKLIHGLFMYSKFPVYMISIEKY